MLDIENGSPDVIWGVNGSLGEGGAGILPVNGANARHVRVKSGFFEGRSTREFLARMAKPRFATATFIHTP
ncbi:MAG: hypothetical protein H7A52_17475 [Akkermansiaceae bacterium]|nr:hypothetical protein [Akkermansiaceae bacterium]